MNQTGKVSFNQAFKDFWKGYVKFRGRTTRAGYWWAYLSCLLLWLIPIVTLFISPTLSGILMVILSLIELLPMLSMQCRRLQDLGLSFDRSLFIIIIPIFLSFLYSIIHTFVISGFIILVSLSILVLYCLPTDIFKQKEA